MMSEVLELTRELIARPSLTPEDAGCQEFLEQYLAPYGFVAEDLSSGDVINTWLHRDGSTPALLFAGHTDVVPTGPAEQWRSEPFTPTVHDGMLYGRGAADMKASVAAMAVACARFVETYPDAARSPGLLLTSDEEGPATEGTCVAVKELAQRDALPDWCLVGEPSCREHLGDTVKHGRRGSLSGHLVVRGKQGHIAYPALCRNPIHAFGPALVELAGTVWDEGDAHFQPTRLQFSNVHAGTGAINVVPGELHADFNLRYSPAVTPEGLRARIEEILKDTGIDGQIDWNAASLPYLTPPGLLSDACRASVAEVLGIETELRTDGGTSDGRFLSAAGVEVVEFGPVNRTIHAIDEQVAVADLEPLAEVYLDLAARLLLRDRG